MKALAWALCLGLAAPARALEHSGTPGYTGRYRAAVGTKGMVAADDRIAAEWGAEVLRQGGNAIDAAVATAFALAVTRPQFASLGGGGFLLFCPHPAKPGGEIQCRAIDYRETAPAAARREMFVKDGKARTDLSRNGALASGVPGVVAGLLWALEKYGTFPREKILHRPIELARSGFHFTSYQEEAAKDRWEAMNDAARRSFGCLREGRLAPCPPNTLIRQPELARVLQEVSGSGAKGFYEGWVGAALVRGLREAGGILTESDLRGYRPQERAPLHGRWRGWEIVTMPPPSSGGAVLLQLLEYAQAADEGGAFADGFGSAKALHALAHAMALAFADRSRYFGDPDYVKVPLKELLSSDYLRRRWRETYRPGAAALPASPGELGALKEGSQTTHFSVIDSQGDAVSVTTTINDDYGSGFMPPGTGVMMNNQMDDFSVEPGVPNMYGLVGAEANSIAPGKKPLSSMSPTIVLDSRGAVRIVLGAMGGPKIITGVFQALFNRLYFGMSLLDAVAAPRIHHQWKPAELSLEAFGFPLEVRARLKELGYALREGNPPNQLHALERSPDGRVWGAPDPRAEGAAVPE